MSNSDPNVFRFPSASLQSADDAILQPDQPEDNPFDSTPEEEESKPVRCRAILGEAGSGKTYLIKKEIEEDPSAGVLAATTGIAAVNLNTVTINSLLRYYDTDSLQQAYISGRLVRTLAELAMSYRQLVIDEFSMLDARQLDTLYAAVKDANAMQRVKKSKNPEGIGITLVGDFAQLPAIKCQQAYEAECWPEFEANTEVLTHNYRQGSGDFLAGINLLRKGDGPAGAEALKRAGVQFTSSNQLDFPGTTILAKNDEVDRFNWVALSKLTEPIIAVKSERWIHAAGKVPSEWKSVPEALQVKKGAFVMILANDSPTFSYANGDTGWIEEYDELAKCFKIRLVRGGGERRVFVPMIERRVMIKDDPRTLLDPDDATSLTFSRKRELNGEPRPWNEPYYDVDSEKYVVGAVKFSPVRLAYASTVHKTQGLSLDAVQMDIRQKFFGSASMIYVAVSRCRTAEGLRIVGSPELLAQRTKIKEEVRRWL